MPKGRFQLVKHDEKLDELVSKNMSNDQKKNLSSTNRLLNRGGSFVKDWEVSNKVFYISYLLKKSE